MPEKISANKSSVAAAALLILAASGSPAWANAGTPLMWLGCSRLLFVNILLGIGEGVLIARIFKIDRKKTTRVMILANYFSMLVGEIWLLNIAEPLKSAVLGKQPLYRAPALLVGTLIAAFLLTVVLEWPFCLWAFKKECCKFRKSPRASLVAQTASYTVLVLLYIPASGLSLYTRVDIDRSLSLRGIPEGWVYFVSPDDGNIYRTRLNGSSQEKIVDTKPGKDSERAALFAWPSGKAGYWDLWFQAGRDQRELLLEKFATKAARPIHDRYGRIFTEDSNEPANPHTAPWLVADLRDPANRNWKVVTGFWPIEGLRAENKETRESVWVALETPFLWWQTCYATVLPGDRVVYQLGDQVVLLDLNLRKIGLIALGRGPVVTLD